MKHWALHMHPHKRYDIIVIETLIIFCEGCQRSYDVHVLNRTPKRATKQWGLRLRPSDTPRQDQPIICELKLRTRRKNKYHKMNSNVHKTRKVIMIVNINELKKLYSCDINVE